MRILILFFAVLLLASTATTAQIVVVTPPMSVPQGINYQAVARDNNGNALANSNVSFRISILKGLATGPSQYTEIHQSTTNDQGLVNFVISRGTVISGNYSLITWVQEGPYFLKVEMARAGQSYSLMGTSEILSTPYAHWSANSIFAHAAGPIRQVGELAEGGMVIATWDGGRHGWVVALEDEPSVGDWYSAKIACENAATGGYRDWALPTITQLRLIYKEKESIGNFPKLLYWSISEGFSEDEFGIWSIFFKAFSNSDVTYQEGQEILAEDDESDKETNLLYIGVRAVRVF